MKELFDALDTWAATNQAVAVARVVDLDGSGPRLPGAAMAVTESSDVRGSVSGGCVEGAVVVAALEILAGGASRMVSFGFSDDDAAAVGLTCGGTVHLFIEAFVPGNDAGWYVALKAAIEAEQPVALATVIDGPNVGAKLVVRGAPPTAGSAVPSATAGSAAPSATAGSAAPSATAGSAAPSATVSPAATAMGSLGEADLDRVVERDSRGELAAGRSGLRHYGVHGEAREGDVSVFIESFAPPPRMLIFGAVDFTAALARVAKVLGYRVTVCDARGVFATPQRFPMADEVVVDWPDRLLAAVDPKLGSRDVVCILTHDAKFDIPAVTAALVTDVGYIGVMGSRRTHDDRTARLRDAGVDDAGLHRLRSPIGLDLGARTPEETAVSIMAEIIAERTGRSVGALTDTSGPIHD